MERTVKNEASANKTALLDALSAALVIDKHNLDEGWVEQPDIFWRVADALAQANYERDTYKGVRDSIIATVDVELRADAQAAGTKITETSLAKEVELDERVRDARVKYQGLCFAAERWQGLKEAFQQRSYALKDLSNLHIANYYQTNSGGERREEAATRARQLGGEERRQRNKGA